MFIGHFAVGFASKRLAPDTSEGALLLAPLFLDVLWPVFLALGIEKVRIDPGNTAYTPLDFVSYPWSHSLVMSLVWSVVLGALVLAATRSRRGALVVGAGVFSHWVMDFVTHRPDLPLAPGSTHYFGLGLWRSVPATMIVEIIIYVVCMGIYVRTTRARDRIGAIAFWVLAILLLVLYLVSSFGPPPPDVKSLIVVGFVAWLFIPWAWWIGRHRVVV
jgi:membrane-bound metal-dependent hydrolase YbcI (DUF457 family)